MRFPLQLMVVTEDQRRAGQMIRRADHFSRAPTVLFHDFVAVVEILDGVMGLSFLDDGGLGDSICLGEQSHGMCFDKFIMGSRSGHYDVIAHSLLELAYTLHHPLALLWRWRSVRIGRTAKHNERIHFFRFVYVCSTCEEVRP